ncbi:MAG TPA: amidohydrolase family protein [Xanthobacteraceae bacterium]
MSRRKGRSSGALSRREVFKAGAAFAAMAPLFPAAAAAQGAPAADAGAAERVARANADPNRRLLLKGGTIVSLDRQVGDLAQGDVLIERKRIAAVAPNIAASGAEVIDAANTIVIPGFVDAHRHSWEGQLRRINPNAPTLAAYSAATHLSFAKAYRPQDMYVGNLLTALGCIDAGITCVIDNSHNARSARHSDEAIRALAESGIRAVHASGAPQAGDWDRQWPQDLERLKKQYFASDDQLLTLRMFSGPDRDNWMLARRLGLRITTEFNGPRAAELIEPFASERLLGPDNTFNHCGALPERTWQHIRDGGVNVNVCPRSDSQYALGDGLSGFQKALDHDLKPGFSVDNETSYGTDMFTEMRVAFHIQRALAANRKLNGEPTAPRPVSTRTVLECATLNGAICAGLAGKIGTLTPGKEADIVLIRTDAINLYPSNHALGTVVAAADGRNVDTVIIAGRVAKFRGALLGLDWDRFRRLVDESRGYLFEKVGYKPDLFAEEFKLA